MIPINPSDNAQQVIDAHPENTHFIFKRGEHRHASFTPKDGCTFTGEDGAALNGARILTGWQQDGELWFVDRQPMPSIGPVQVGGIDVTTPEGPRANWQVDVFVDDVPLRHVDDLRQVAPGKWFFDSNRGRIYIGQDPNKAQRIECAETEIAIRLDGVKNVTIENLTVEKYANRHQIGAIHGTRSEGMQVRGVTCRLNHGLGLKYGSNAVIQNSRFNDNGQLGLGGMGDNVLIEFCEFARNNYAYFSAKFEAGGTKFSRSSNLTVRGCYVHHNKGKGLWLDIDNGHAGKVIIEDCIAYENAGIGIYHEIGWDCIIRNNWSGLNARDDWDGGLYGAQIMVGNSSYTEVHDNTVIVPATGGNGIAVRQTQRHTSPIRNEEWLCNENIVRDNTIIYLGDKTVRSGGMAYHRRDLFQRRGNNVFQGNRYYVQQAGAYHWRWMEDLTFQQWQAVGHDLDGAVIPQAQWPQGLTDVPAWAHQPEVVAAPTIEEVTVPIIDPQSHAFVMTFAVNGGINRAFSVSAAELPLTMTVAAEGSELTIKLRY